MGRIATTHLAAPLLAATLLVGGCATDDEAYVVKHCLDFGLYPDTREYLDCIQDSYRELEYNRRLRQYRDNPL